MHCKGKPIARWGRKATGPTGTAGLPGWSDYFIASQRRISTLVFPIFLGRRFAMGLSNRGSVMASPSQCNAPLNPGLSRVAIVLSAREESAVTQAYR
jgi:hypothetical protein